MTGIDGDPPPATRLGLIGDIHGEHPRLATSIELLVGLGVERLLCTGDVVEATLDADAERCCELLRAHGVLTVRGNHDRWLVGDPAGTAPALDFLGGLPATRRIETVAGPLLLGHGVGADDMCRLTPDDYGYALEANLALQELIDAGEHRVIVGGHTHLRMVRRLGPLIVVNPGALRFARKPGCALLDLDARRVDFYDLADDGGTALARSVDLDRLPAG